jgi:hypothetical protein
MMSQQQAMSTPLLPLYFDLQTRFSVRLPSGWLVDHSGAQGTRLTLFSPHREMGFQANLNIHVQPLHGSSSEDYLAATRWQLQQLTGQEKPERDEPNAGPCGGHLLEWSATIGTLALHFCQLIVVAGDQTYVLTGTAPVASFSRYRAAFQMVFASFTLVPEGEPMPEPSPPS